MLEEHAPETPPQGKLIQKVPGELVPIGRLQHELKRFEDEIKSKSVPELKDLLARQEKVLNNKRLCALLPDKGDKVRARRDKIQKLLEEKTRLVDDTAALLSGLTIGGRHITPEEMEWKYGGGLASALNSRPTTLDSDDSDDEDGVSSSSSKNPLKVLTEKEVPRKYKRKTGSENEMENEMENERENEAGQEEASDLSKAAVDSSEDKHSQHIAAKVDHAEPAKERFLPFHTLNHRTLPENMEMKLKRRENLSDRPKVEVMPLPDVSHAKACVLSLSESLQIQRDQAEQHKELQVMQAVEKLRARTARAAATEATAAAVAENADSSSALRGQASMAYRDTKRLDDTDDDDSDEERGGGDGEGGGDDEVQEVYDDDEDEGGREGVGISFSVIEADDGEE